MGKGWFTTYKVPQLRLRLASEEVMSRSLYWSLRTWGFKLKHVSLDYQRLGAGGRYNECNNLTQSEQLRGC